MGARAGAVVRGPCWRTTQLLRVALFRGCMGRRTHRGSELFAHGSVVQARALGFGAENAGRCVSMGRVRACHYRIHRAVGDRIRPLDLRPFDAHCAGHRLAAPRAVDSRASFHAWSFSSSPPTTGCGPQPIATAATRQRCATAGGGVSLQTRRPAGTFAPKSAWHTPCTVVCHVFIRGSAKQA